MTMIRTLLHRRDGTASIEFALVSLFLFGTVMVALDFGLYVQQKLKLGQAVEAGAIMAFNQQVGASTSGISDYVQSYAGTRNTPTVAITCNGSSDTSNCASGKCSCLTAAGDFTGLGGCSSPKASCATGGIQGNYMKITATLPYTSIAVPNRYLGGKDIVQTAVVRLQ